MKPAIRKLVEEQVKALDAAKVQMHLCVMWKQEEEAVFKLDNGEEERITHEVKVEKVFISAMTELFQGSDAEEILKTCLRTSRLKSSILRYPRVVSL